MERKPYLYYQIPITKMATLDFRQSVLEYVKRADNRFLRLVKVMADNYHEKDDIVAYTVDGKSLTLEQYNQELLDAEAEIERGETISLEDLEKEARDW